MDLRKLKKLIDLVEESGIAELELTEDGEKVRISRNFTANAPAQQYSNYAPPQHYSTGAPAAPAAAPATPAQHRAQGLRPLNPRDPTGRWALQDQDP